MINTEDLEYRKLDISGVKILADWARQEGWNPGPHDAEVFFATDPEGFYGFYLNKSLIAGGAIVSYGKEFGFMGLFIVKPEFRGHGLGRKLWYLRRNMLIDRLKPGAPIGMDGVVAMQPFYNKGGFEIAYTEERYERAGTSFKMNEKISSIVEDDFARILSFDERCFGFSRPQFLKPWIFLPGNKSFKYEEEDSLKGYVVVRKAEKGYKIGPLFAEEPAVAEALYRAALSSVEGELLYIDVPMINQEAVNLIKKYEGKYVFECARMYYGRAPRIDVNLIYGVSSFELG